MLVGDIRFDIYWKCKLISCICGVRLTLEVGGRGSHHLLFDSYLTHSYREVIPGRVSQKSHSSVKLDVELIYRLNVYFFNYFCVFVFFDYSV